MLRVYPQVELFHVHIPKTAGTSLNSVFERVYGQAFCNHELARLEVNSKVRMAAAHIPLRTARQQFPNAVFVTVLREPERRIKSTLRHLYARRNWPAYAKIGPQIDALIDGKGYVRPTEEVLTDVEFRNRFDNLLVRYLTLDSVQGDVAPFHAQSAIEACGELRQILFQDRFSEGVAELFSGLGHPGTQDVETNRAKSDIPIWDSVPDFFEPFLVHDYTLYRNLIDSRE